MEKFLYLAPRLASSLMGVYLVLSIGDSVDRLFTDASVSDMVQKLIRQLLIVIIIVAWKWEQIGGWLFVLLGIGAWFVPGFDFVAPLLFSVSCIGIGGMYLWHYYTFPVANPASSATPDK